jgi:hypothetical protein
MLKRNQKLTNFKILKSEFEHPKSEIITMFDTYLTIIIPTYTDEQIWALLKNKIIPL